MRRNEVFLKIDNFRTRIKDALHSLQKLKRELRDALKISDTQWDDIGSNPFKILGNVISNFVSGWFSENKSK